MTRLLRLGGLAMLGGLGVWAGRLLAHSRVPPPEGRWREVTNEELG